MKNQSISARSGCRLRATDSHARPGTPQRSASAAILALAATAALIAAPPAFATTKPAHPAQPTETAAQRQAGEPIMAIVSIKSQHVTFYDADGWILRAPVSTGTTGRETPAGVFAVVEKDKDHHSSLYDDAWMPNMLRITWSGIALHGGPLPGYAASHGCIRMPYDFAEKVFDQASIGMRVIISPNDAEPVAFSHPSLFVPKQDAIDAAPAQTEALTRAADEATEAAAAAKTAAATAKRQAAAAPAELRKLEFLKSRADAEVAYAKRAIDVAKANEAKAENVKQKAAAKVEELRAQLESLSSRADAGLADTDQMPDAAKTSKTNDAKAEGVTQKAPVTVAKPHTQLEYLNSRAAAELAYAERALEAAKANEAKAEQAEQKATAKAEELRTQVEAAKAEQKTKQDAVAAALALAKTTEAKRIEAARAAKDAKLALEPVSIFISRATGKLYVRRDTHKPEPDGGDRFDTIEVPVTIQNPGKPIGTHIFTAVAPSNDGLRWTEITIDDGDNAKDALDRITFPKEVLDRIAPTTLPRSSIIISDEPPNRETNYRTEFVVVLNNQPQGGLAMRKPPEDGWGNGSGGFFSSNGNGGFFGSWFNRDSQPSPAPQRRGFYYPGQQGSW
jgi:lipoprotein-anchoring transpeptidase ErfK/SrfK